jgi:hypothetical protein
VIAVASGRHEALLTGLGVDRFIDYTTLAPEDVVRDGGVARPRPL